MKINKIISVFFLISCLSSHIYATKQNEWGMDLRIRLDATDKSKAPDSIKYLIDKAYFNLKGELTDNLGYRIKYNFLNENHSFRQISDGKYQKIELANIILLLENFQVKLGKILFKSGSFELENVAKDMPFFHNSKNLEHFPLIYSEGLQVATQFEDQKVTLQITNTNSPKIDNTENDFEPSQQELSLSSLAYSGEAVPIPTLPSLK